MKASPLSLSNKSFIMGWLILIIFWNLLFILFANTFIYDIPHECAINQMDLTDCRKYTNPDQKHKCLQDNAKKESQNETRKSAKSYFNTLNKNLAESSNFLDEMFNNVVTSISNANNEMINLRTFMMRGIFAIYTIINEIKDYVVLVVKKFFVGLEGILNLVKSIKIFILSLWFSIFKSFFKTMCMFPGMNC